MVSAARLPTERMLYDPTIANICNFESISYKMPSYVIIGTPFMYLPTGGKTEKTTPSIYIYIPHFKQIFNSIQSTNPRVITCSIRVRFAAFLYPFWRIHISTISQKLLLALETCCLSIKSSTKGIFKIVSFDLAHTF